MRKPLPVLLTGLVAFFGVACVPGETPEPESEYRPTASIKGIMLAVIDPNANSIWDSSAILVDAEGIHETFPQTDDEWTVIRNDAIRIMEASNLLLIPGRRVAAPGDESEFPGIELEPDATTELIARDRDTFVELAHGLHEAAGETLATIEAQDSEALLLVGDTLD